MGFGAPMLSVDLPPGWSRHDEPGGPLDFRPQADGALGLLQASLLPPQEFARLSQAAKLGPEVADLGLELSFGAALVGEQDAPCAMGRMAFALFKGEAAEGAPALLFWVTLSKSRAWLWTFAGPDADAPAVKQAMQVVISAREQASALPVLA
jgi:hypothetical protein